ncbi:MAG: TetR/AcrR family transcriptional regulator [Myxococcales bacterium]|nr:TetR/AcrR family transcriptional regulator [Myxococcales bacterium]
MNRRATLKQQRRELVRTQILDATQHVVLRAGIGGLTLTAVAKELQLTKAALYYYFASKDALLLELVYRAHAEHAEMVGEAVAKATSGADAVEALIRSTTAWFGDNKDALRLAFLAPQLGPLVPTPPEQLERMRPLNELIFGAVQRRIAADQKLQRIPAHIDGRRLAFVAYTSVLGMLTMEGLVERSDDPLVHSRKAMTDELVEAFVGRLA